MKYLLVGGYALAFHSRPRFTISGVQFESAWENKITGSYFNEVVNIISLKDFISNKEESGRDKGKQDLKWLNQYRKQTE